MQLLSLEKYFHRHTQQHNISDRGVLDSRYSKTVRKNDLLASPVVDECLSYSRDFVVSPVSGHLKISLAPHDLGAKV